MTIGYDSITLGSETIYLTNIRKLQVPGTIKQVVGGNIVKHNIPGRSIRDWEINGNGLIFGAEGVAATTARSNLEALDDLTPHHYSDGLMTASVYIQSLQFTDRQDNTSHYTYTIRLTEFNQSE